MRFTQKPRGLDPINVRGADIVRGPQGGTWIRLIKFSSLQILVVKGVPFKNPLDDILSSLSISSNMLMKAGEGNPKGVKKLMSTDCSKIGVKLKVCICGFRICNL